MLDLHVASNSVSTGEMKEGGVFGSACDVSNRIGFAGAKKMLFLSLQERMERLQLE
jgi:hypothetical protein